MIQTINNSQFHAAFKNFDRADNFSYKGLNKLFDYLEEYEDSTDTKIELDVIAICCDYTEDKIENVLKEYKLSTLEDLYDRTQVIVVDDETIIYQAF